MHVVHNRVYIVLQPLAWAPQAATAEAPQAATAEAPLRKKPKRAASATNIARNISLRSGQPNMHVAGCTPISILYVVMLVQMVRSVHNKMANTNSGREAAKVTDYKNLSPKCLGAGKGCPKHVTDKPALLHYVTGVMSHMRTAINLVKKG